MTLRLRTRAFRIEHATIGAALLRPYWKRYDATVADALGWFLSVTCSEREFDGESWQPEFNFQRFALPIERWAALEHLPASVEGGAAHVVGHGPIGRTELSFGVHVQARPDPRSGLWQPAAGAAACPARADRGSNRAAVCRPLSGAGRAPGPPRLAWRAVA